MMIIFFNNKKDKKLFESNKELRKKFGKEQAEKIMLRLTQLESAENLEALRSLSQIRAHELSGNRKGQISLDLKQPYRFLIVPDHKEISRKEDGGLDWKNIKTIMILGVEDTHA
ncbi:MAG: type II toxin-antitoxin system RelE/ParE family toxin [Pseudomonadota bacterium]